MRNRTLPITSSVSIPTMPVSLLLTSTSVSTEPLFDSISPCRKALIVGRSMLSTAPIRNCQTAEMTSSSLSTRKGDDRGIKKITLDTNLNAQGPVYIKTQRIGAMELRITDFELRIFFQSLGDLI